MSKSANLRCCASCKWIYKGCGKGCPQCEFPSYGARYVFGNAAYRHAKTQKPWFDEQMWKHRQKLYAIIDGEEK